MNAAAIPQREALVMQLALLAGNAPAHEFIELRAFSPGERRSVGRVFVGVRDLDRACFRALDLAQRGDVYVGAVPRLRRSGTARDLGQAWGLWCDLDGLAPLQRLADFSPLPSMVVRSGSEDHAHAWWSLREPVPPDWAMFAARRLALALGGDFASTDPARVLRCAGTLNHKHTPPAPVICTYCEPGTFTIEEVVGGLPDDRSYAPPPRPLRSAGATDLDGLVRTVREAPEGERNQALYWAACRLYEHVHAGDADEQVGREALRDAALAAGLPEGEIEATLDSASRSAAA